MDEEGIRESLVERRKELQRRSKRDRSSARSSSSRDSIGAELEDVDRALRMLEKGTYGTCEACGLPISLERLEAQPAARFCLADQQKVDR